MESVIGDDSCQRVKVVCVGVSPDFVRRLDSHHKSRFDVQSCDAESTLSIGVQIVIHRPRLVLIPENLLCDRGVSFIVELSNLDHEAAIAIVGKDINAATIAECIPLGFSGLINPKSSGEEIVRALEAICEGEVWVPRHRLVEAVRLLTAGTEESRTKVWSNLPTLTDREHDVFIKVMEGCSNRDIAQSLGISGDTVKVHLKHIFSKLGVHRRTELLSQRL